MNVGEIFSFALNAIKDGKVRPALTILMVFQISLKNIVIMLIRVCRVRLLIIQVITAFLVIGSIGSVTIVDAQQVISFPSPETKAYHH